MSTTETTEKPEITADAILRYVRENTPKMFKENTPEFHAYSAGYLSSVVSALLKENRCSTYWRDHYRQRFAEGREVAS